MKITIHEVTFTVIDEPPAKRSHKMQSANDFETAPCTPTMGGIENDIIPLDWDIEDRILDDLDAQLEDECLESIWSV